LIDSTDRIFDQAIVGANYELNTHFHVKESLWEIRSSSYLHYKSTLEFEVKLLNYALQEKEESRN